MLSLAVRLATSPWAFTIELAGYIAESGIDYWIYGHSHRNIDKTIGTTRCVSSLLQRLVREGRLIRIGDGCQTRYRPAPGHFGR